MTAQAILETGWGKYIPRDYKTGETSNNLFGIKAQPRYSGRYITCLTTEYVNGKWKKIHANFRKYGSYKESILDYAHFLMNNSRYSHLFDNNVYWNWQKYLNVLKDTGYATDPFYTQKLHDIIVSFILPYKRRVEEEMAKGDGENGKEDEAEGEKRGSGSKETG